MQNAGLGGGDAQTAACGLRHAQTSPALRRRQALWSRRGFSRSDLRALRRGGRMKLQKEKVLAPQKKNLKTKRESEGQSSLHGLLFSLSLRTDILVKLGAAPFVFK